MLEPPLGDNQQPSPLSTTGEGSTTIPKGSRGQAASKQENPLRVCRLCMTAKSTDEFYMRREGPLRRECKDCFIIRQRQRMLGISEAEYQVRFKEQGGKCAICHSPFNGKYKRLSVDHCHRSKKVRGLLCSNCNTALGLLKDNPTRLLRAIAYLEKI